MQLMYLIVSSCLLLCIMFSSITAKPTFGFLDGYAASVERISNDDYYTPYQQPISDYRLSRLRRGYYYVEDGYITAVPESAIVASRRADATVSRDDSSNPLVKYKQTHAKRKKLFVPNLFG